jgi:hypothetical protein
VSLKTHKSEYTILAVLAAVTGLVLFWMVWRGLVHEQTAGRSGLRTTRSTNIDGTLACYLLFERLGIPVERSNEMLRAERLDDAAVVFLLDPIVPVRLGEAADLGTWLARGGVLVTTDIPHDLAPALDRLSSASPARWQRHASRAHETPAPTRVTSPEARSLPLARDVAAVQFETAAVLDRKPSDANDSRVVRTPLFTDERGVRLAEYALGRGRIILLADSSFLANGRIAQADNAVLAANLVSYARARATGARVVFDEYHFGFGGQGGGFRVLAGMLFTTSAGWAVLALTAAGSLFLWCQGRQFGPRRGFGKQRRRSKMEYVQAVGATYRAAGAHRLTLRLLYNWFRQRLTSQAGLPAGAANGLVAQELARRGRAPAADYQRALDECDRILSQAAVSQRQLAAVVAQLARIEKEIADGFGNGKRPSR